MPKNKFNGFYYGIGMKLDEASVDQAGQQLEGRLNQVVDKVTQKVVAMSDAIAKGVKDVDAKELVKSLTDAQRELNHFQDFDPSKLQKQIDKLSGTVDSLGDQFKDVSSQLKTFTDDVTSRLSSIEIKTSKQGKDALKRDLKEMKQLAQGYSDVISKGEKIDTSGLDRYIKKIKDGLASIKSSGNPMEMFADNELAHDFVAVTKILRQMGVSADSLRGDFYELSSTFKGVFEKSSAKGAQTIFKDVGYQIETVNEQLKKAQANLARYEANITKTKSRTKTTGFDVTIAEDKNLNFDQKIAKIQEYGDIIAELDYGETWATATKNQIALIQSAEKELQSILKTSDGQVALEKWQKTFGFDLTDKMSANAISEYVDVANEELQRFQSLRVKTIEEIKSYEAELGKLRAKEEITTSSKKSKKTAKSSNQKQQADGVVAEVSAKIKINEEEWRKAINRALTNVEPKVKPFKIKVEATSGNILKEVKKIREASLVNKGKDGSSDVKAFDDRYKKFYDNLVKRRQDIITELKQNWHPALKDAFSFRMELLGIDNKSMTQNISTHILSTVDAINTVLEEKPLIFHSNIENLLEEVQEKVKDLKLEGNIGIGAGNVTINPQSLGNVGIILNGIAQSSNIRATQPVAPISSPTPPIISPPTSNGKSVNIQEIYDSIGAIDRSTLTLESVQKAAQKLEQQLINAEDGTEEYYRAQIELAKLLAAWRYKIGNAAKGKTPEVAGIMGPGKSAAQKWNEYLKTNGILVNPKDTRILSKSQLGTKYSIDTKESTKAHNKKSSKKQVLTAEDITATRLRDAKQAIQYFIELAELGKSLGSIREIADKPITADTFKNGEIEKWIRGHKYTKDDINSYAPGKKATPQAVNEFLSTMGITESELDKVGKEDELRKLVNTLKSKGYRTEEEEQQLKELEAQLKLQQTKNDLLKPLKQYIYTFMQQRQQLNTLVQELLNGPKASSKGIAQGYLDAGDDTTSYLVNELSDVIGKLVVKNPKTRAQESVSRAFANAGIDLSELSTLTDPNKKFELLQNQLLNRKTYTIGDGDVAFNIPWEQWIKRFASSGYGANYEKLFALLKLGREYSSSYNALSEVGKEANALVVGRTEIVDKRRRRWNNQTGQYDYIEGEVNQTIQQGIRGMLKSLEAVFEDKTGQAILGYNLGKGYISNDNFLSANSSFTQIIKELTKASELATKISFGKRVPFANGSTDFDKWEAPSNTPSSSFKDYSFTKITTEKQNIEQWIKNINGFISGAKNTLKSLDEELSTILAKEDNTLSSKDDVSKITQTQSQINTKITELQQKREQITQQNIKIEDLKNNLTNPTPLYEDILKSLLDEESKLAKLESEIANKQANKKNYNDDLEIDKLLEQKKQIKNRIDNLNASIGVAPLGADDQKINSEIEKETAEISRLEAELQQKQGADKQAEKTQLEQEIARKKGYIENLSTALQKRERVKTKDVLESELSNRQSELIQMQNEEVELKNQLSLLNEELTKFGSADAVKRVIEIVREQEKIATEIKEKQSLLEQRQKEVKTANKTKSYSKSYNQAISDLPTAQAGREYARANLAALVNQYTAERMGAVTDALTRKQTGSLSAAEVQNIQSNLHNIIELNKQLQSGTITQTDYVEKLVQAYIVMRNITTDEAKATAKADAERLADATLLVKKYQEEEAVLQRIIKTQKPKEVVSTQPNITGDKQPSTQSVIGGSTTTNINEPQNVVIPGGNIVLGGVAGGTGLATESTVSKIYALLSVKKDGGYSSRIEELKKLIALKEVEEREALENARKKKEEEKKATGETNKKVAEEKKGTEEVKKKVAEEKKATTEAKKSSDTEKQKTQEVRKQADTEKKKTSEGQKQVALEQKETKATQQNIQVSTKDFLASVNKLYKEVEAGKRVFREHQFTSSDGVISESYKGLIAHAAAVLYSDFDTSGHLHPRNTMYSAADIKSMANIRNNRDRYDTDVLVTPDYVYKLKGLSKVSSEALDNLAEQFRQFEKSNMNLSLSTKAKESLLYYFAQDNGLSYSKHTYNTTGKLTDITSQEKIIGKEIFTVLKEFVSVLQNNKHNTGESYKAWQNQKQALMDKMRQDEMLNSLMLSSDNDKERVRLLGRASGEKHRSATLIQEAIDYDFDFSLFVPQFKRFFTALSQLGEAIPSGSPLAQIKQYVEELEHLEVGSDAYKNLVNKIKTLSSDVFDKNKNPTLDLRKSMAKELLEVAKSDSSGKIVRTVEAEAKRMDKENVIAEVQKQLATQIKTTQNDAIEESTLAELKAELAHLEKLQNNDEVDPRFATAENQKIIIDLLKNGIKVAGTKDGGDTSSSKGGTTKPRTPQVPNITKANLQADEINKLTNINKDSALYKQYIAAKQQLDQTVAAVVAKGKNRTKEDAEEIKALSSAVTSLGKQIITSANNFDQFKARGGEAFSFTAKGAQTLEDEMRELAHNDALKSGSLLRDISYDEVTQKMSYSLTDLEGNVTKVTMAYSDLLGMVMKTSDKTTTSASKLYNAIEGEMTQRIGINDVVAQTPLLGDSKQYQAYITAYNNMMKAQDALRTKGTMATQAEKNELTSLIGKVEEARGKFEQLAKASAEFDSKIRGGNTKSDVDPANLEAEMKAFVLSQEGLTQSQKETIEQTWSFKNAQDGATYSMRQGKNEMASMSVIFDEGTRRIGQYTVETKKYKTGMEKFMDSLKGKWQEVARYLMTFGSMYRVFAIFRQGVTYVREIDSALTELKKVTDETEKTYDRFLKTAAKTADKVGSTIKEVVSSTADWSRLGYSLEDAIHLAESTSVLLNVSEFQSIDEATSALTSTLQAFGYTANQSMRVVDVMNEIGNNFAVSSDGIATALQDSASSLMAANNSYEEAVALIAAANRVVILRHGL